MGEASKWMKKKINQLYNNNLIKHKMKKIFTFCAAVAMFAACAKETPKSSVDGISAPAENAEAASVLFKSNVTASVQAKAQGGVDAWNGHQNLYVYGFQRQAEAIDYSTADPFIDNVSAVSPLKDAESNAIAVLDKDNKPFYYNGNFTYDFYGYYVDDLVAEPEAREDGIYVPLTLTGGEDIMIAKSVPSVDVQKAKDAGVFTGGDSWKDAYAYSAYAARRGVQPSLTFKHQLVRFTFQITSGSDFETTGDLDKNLFVKGLTISARNTADLCVAGKTTGLVNIGEELAELSLCSLVDETLVEMVTYEVPDKDADIEPGSNVLGESLMVIPNDTPAEGAVDSYSITLEMEQAGKTIDYPVDLKFSSVQGAPEGQTQFTAGYSYRVTVKVYGLEQVELSAELEPWVPGGDIVIDTDDAPEVYE